MKNVFSKFLKIPLARENFANTLKNVQASREEDLYDDITNLGQLARIITSYIHFSTGLHIPTGVYMRVLFNLLRISGSFTLREQAHIECVARLWKKR